MYTKSSEEDRAFLESVKGREELDAETISRASDLFYQYAFTPIYSRLKKVRGRLRKKIRRLDIDPEVAGMMSVMITILRSNKLINMMKLEKEHYESQYLNQ